VYLSICCVIEYFVFHSWQASYYVSLFCHSKKIMFTQDAFGNMAGPLFRFVHVMCPPPRKLCILRPAGEDNFANVSSKDIELHLNAQPSCSVGGLCLPLREIASHDAPLEEAVRPADGRSDDSASRSRSVEELSTYIEQGGWDGTSSEQISIKPQETEAASAPFGNTNNANFIAMSLIGPPVLWVRVPCYIAPLALYFHRHICQYGWITLNKHKSYSRIVASFSQSE
jgi:hypothetical protein